MLVHVGKSVFLDCRNEEEIIQYLWERNILISGSSIRYLAKKFIVYLAIAHRESSVRLKKDMARRGGYILHLDATCEGDSPHLISGLDGMSEIVLDNVKLPSEIRNRLKHYGVSGLLRKMAAQQNIKGDVSRYTPGKKPEKS